jgi:CRP-like cAMP-binding protein
MRPVNPFVWKLQQLIDLTEAEREALGQHRPGSEGCRADVDLISEGDRALGVLPDLEGFACRYKLLSDGRRQIMSFQIPGDLCDLPSLFLPVMDHSIGTLTASKVAWIPHEAVLRLLETYPRINQAFWRDSLIDAAIFREWVVNVGQRSAYERAAHLMCEIFIRFKALGLTNGKSFDLPITQAELADALGLSTVHVNRTLHAAVGRLHYAA